MIDGKPNYTRLSTMAMADVVLMDQDGRLHFVNALCEMFDNLTNPDYMPEEVPGIVGRSIMRQFSEFQEGVKKYLENVNRNPSGLPKNEHTPVGNPVGTPVGTPTPTQCQPQKEIEEEIEREEEKKENYKPPAPAETNQQQKKKSERPTLEELTAYCKEKGLTYTNPQAFMDYYDANGWKVGKNPMKDWQAAARNWDRREREKGGGNNGGGYTGNHTGTKGPVQPDYTFLRGKLEGRV